MPRQEAGKASHKCNEMNRTWVAAFDISSCQMSSVTSGGGGGEEESTSIRYIWRYYATHKRVLYNNKSSAYKYNLSVKGEFEEKRFSGYIIEPFVDVLVFGW